MKYIIHYHSNINEQQDHYDFMLEQDAKLATWQILYPDMARLITGTPISASKIHDHRKKYLSYEGPISCDRGMVNIFDSGEYATIADETDSLHIEIKGSTLKGTLYIENTNIDGRYRLRYVPEINMKSL